MIVLDTQAWIWWISDPNKLGRTAKQEIRRTTKIGVPAVCCMEVATLAARGRITLDRPPLQWLQDSLAVDRVDLLALRERAKITWHSAEVGQTPRAPFSNSGSDPST